ncbi:MAG: OPT/YSL family transporter [Alphaproteobacteria bacterium]|nr:OPT/YSL family transporter [Alphaproteobacteria bacterium]
MSEVRRTGLARQAGAPFGPAAGPAGHPRTFAPATLVLILALSVFGAVIGVQLIVQLGVTPNTSIIGALVAMLLARAPLALFARYRSVHVQNLAQSAISAATFGAANGLLLPIGVPFLLGRPDLVLPMLIGAALSTLLDGYMLYRMFDTRVFPAGGAWPPGIAAAEAIRAGDAGGRRAALLAIGLLVGLAGSWCKIPMSAFGVAFIGNVWALAMFGIGLLIRGYAGPVAGLDIAKLYVPHGFMIGAGIVALGQVATLIIRRGEQGAAAGPSGDRRLGAALGLGGIGFVAIAVLIAAIGGLVAALSPGMLIAFVVYAAFAAFVHELIVGISAMHAGWFPAFAVALITLIIGILIGFPPVALALLVGFSASTGPAFADMGYDLRAGFLLRGLGADPAFERDGRRQQLYAAMVAFLIAIPTVWLAYPGYFAHDLVPPVDRVYVATIKAGATAEVAKALLIWAVPGAVLQWLGGPSRQLGILFATGLLIPNPMAGWAVLAGIAIRVAWLKWKGAEASGPMEVLAAGFIGGDALFGFFDSVLKTVPSGK